MYILMSNLNRKPARDRREKEPQLIGIDPQYNRSCSSSTTSRHPLRGGLSLAAPSSASKAHVLKLSSHYMSIIVGNSRVPCRSKERKSCRVFTTQATEPFTAHHGSFSRTVVGTPAQLGVKVRKARTLMILDVCTFSRMETPWSRTQWKDIGLARANGGNQPDVPQPIFAFVNLAQSKISIRMASRPFSMGNRGTTRRDLALPKKPRRVS